MISSGILMAYPTNPVAKIGFGYGTAILWASTIKIFCPKKFTPISVALFVTLFVPTMFITYKGMKIQDEGKLEGEKLNEFWYQLKKIIRHPGPLAVTEIKECPAFKNEMMFSEERYSANDQKQGIPTGVLVNSAERTIYLSQRITDMRWPLAFHITQFNLAKELLDPENVCEMSAHEYAMTLENIGYQAVKKTYNLSKECWPLLDLSRYQALFNEEWSTFQGYYEYQEKAGHVGVYQKFWHQQCNSFVLSEFDREEQWGDVKSLNLIGDLEYGPDEEKRIIPQKERKESGTMDQIPYTLPS